ncbi:hypothetical protein [Streptosporangium sp. KLBMP 9127]|nr:hypothetical protein [Streptosporangium sp. KLBMP 9127]
MSDQLVGWPFLISRGRKLGFQVVVVPGFLEQAGEAGVLFAAAETGPGQPTGPGRRVRSVRTANGSFVTLVYRQTRAASDTPVDGDTVLRDRHGRPIPLFEGYALQGRYDDVPISEAEWEHVHAVALTGLLRMLVDEDPGWHPIPGDSVSLSSGAEQVATPPELEPRPTMNARGCRSRLLSIFTVVGLAAVTLWIVLSRLV